MRHVNTLSRSLVRALSLPVSLTHSLSLSVSSSLSISPAHVLSLSLSSVWQVEVDHLRSRGTLLVVFPFGDAELNFLRCFSHMHLCVCVCVCVHVCVRARARACARSCVFMCIYVHAYMHTCEYYTYRPSGDAQVDFLAGCVTLCLMHVCLCVCVNTRKFLCVRLSVSLTVSPYNPEILFLLISLSHTHTHIHTCHDADVKIWHGP